VDEFGKRVGQFPAPGQQVSEYAPSSGVGGTAAKKNAARQDVFSAAYPTRPPGALDFIVDNALSGGGLPLFYIDGELLVYIGPVGYIAIINELSWYITPMSAAINPAQLSMRILLDQAVLQGTDTMGIGQSGKLEGLYIPIAAGGRVSIRLGRGPGVVAYLVLELRDLGPGFVPLLGSSGNSNCITSWNGVLWAVHTDNDLGEWWYSSGGDVWVQAGSFGDVGAPTFPFGNEATAILAFGDKLVISMVTTGVWVSADGFTFAFGGSAFPDSQAPEALFVWNGLLTGWAPITGALYQTQDFGTTWAALVNNGLPVVGDYKFAVLGNELFAMQSYQGNVASRAKLYKTADGVDWALVSDIFVQIPTWCGALGGRYRFVFDAFNGALFLGMGFSSAPFAAKLDMFQSVDGGINWVAVTNNSSLPAGAASSTINAAFGLVVVPWGVATVPAASVNLIPAYYNPELQCYCQLKGQLIKAKGSIQETLVNPL